MGDDLAADRDAVLQDESDIVTSRGALPADG
jgi:hypothetical protein